MQYPDKWVFLYDDETLRNDLEQIDFSKYLKRGEVPLANWKSIDLSYQEYEKSIQKHFVSQVQILLTFFNTESVCSEYKSFQDYSFQMLSFLKSEMLYCFSFWKFATIKDFVRQRLNASLARTHRFLKSLHLNVLDKYLREKKTYDSVYELRPSTDCLNEHLDDMLVEYSQIKTIMAFFEKGYGELYEKLQKFKESYPNDIEMIGKIYYYSKNFFEMNPKGMHVAIAKSIPKDPEKPLLLAIYKSNDEVKWKIDERARGPKQGEQENQIENYFVKQLMNSFVVKKVIEDFQKKPPKEEEIKVEELQPVEKEKPKMTKKSFVAERLKTMVVEAEPEGEDSEENESPVLQLGRARVPTMTGRDSSKSPPKEIGKQKSILKGMDKIFRTSVYTNPSTENEPSGQSPTDKKESISLLDVLKKTANNPYQNNLTNPLMSSLGSKSTTATNLSTALASMLTNTSKLASEPLAQSERLNTDRSEEGLSRKISKVQSSASTEKDKRIEEKDEYHDFLSEVLTDGLITAMVEKKLEPERLRIREEEKEEEMRRRQTVKFKRNTTRFFTKVENGKDNTEDMEIANDGQSTLLKKSRSKGRKREDEIQFDPSIIENNLVKHVPYRENRGQEVADEKILGNLIDDNISDDAQEDEDPEMVDFKKDNTNIPFTNRFIQKVKGLYETNAFPSTHYRPNKHLLDLKPRGDITRVRVRDRWSIIHDNLRAAICQKQLFRILNDDDPTDGLNVAPKHLKFVIRKSQRNKATNAGMKFDSLHGL